MYMWAKVHDIVRDRGVCCCPCWCVQGWPEILQKDIGIIFAQTACLQLLKRRRCRDIRAIVHVYSKVIR